MKKMKESVKEKCKKIGDWTEENAGKLMLATVGIYTVVLGVAAIKFNEHEEAENQKYRDQCMADYRAFLENANKKMFED